MRFFEVSTAQIVPVCFHLALFGVGAVVSAYITQKILDYRSIKLIREEQFELRDEDEGYQLVLAIIENLEDVEDSEVVNVGAEGVLLTYQRLRHLPTHTPEPVRLAYEELLPQELETLDKWHKNGWRISSVKIRLQQEIDEIFRRADPPKVRSYMMKDSRSRDILVTVGPTRNNEIRRILGNRTLY